MNKERFLNTGLLEQYVLGLTDPEETKVVQQHLEAFPELKEEMMAMQMALENYAKQYAIEPPANLKDQVLEGLDNVSSNGSVGQDSHQPVMRRMTWSRWLPYVALFALVAGYFYQANKVNVTKAELRSKNTALANCKSDNEELKKTQEVYAMINDVNTLPVILEGTALSPEAQALVYWNEEEQSAFFFATQLPEPPADKQYQIWADVEGEMISIGLLDYQTNSLQRINHIAHAESLNITLEPKGGSESPNVDLLYVNAPLSI